ncbi:MAG: amidohydrolase family protein [Saccharothrix sp.]|nr:amidohydrolase family protein [Saccharothrix sp.]
MTWVDVHHHAYHGALADALAHRGVTHMAPGVPVPRWRVEDSLRVMENCGLDAAVLSVLMPDKALVLPDAAELVRATNEWTAELVGRHPDRFGLLATLPLPDLDASLAEVGHAYDALHADGVVLPASLADGALLGDPAQEPLFAELDRRAAVVLVHPDPAYRCSHTGAEDFPAVVPPPLVDFVMDTTRAVANLLFRGVLRRYPRIRFVLAHGGGTIPFLAGRLELAETWVLPDRDGSVRDELAGLYYETAQAFSSAALACVDSVAPPGHVLFGTDFPFMGEPVVAATVRDVAAHRAEVGGAALDLFPRLRR